MMHFLFQTWRSFTTREAREVWFAESGNPEQKTDAQKPKEEIKTEVHIDVNITTENTEADADNAAKKEMQTTEDQQKQNTKKLDDANSGLKKLSEHMLSPEETANQYARATINAYNRYKEEPTEANRALMLQRAEAEEPIMKQHDVAGDPLQANASNRLQRIEQLMNSDLDRDRSKSEWKKNNEQARDSKDANFRDAVNQMLQSTDRTISPATRKFLEGAAMQAGKTTAEKKRFELLSPQLRQNPDLIKDHQDLMTSAADTERQFLRMNFGQWSNGSGGLEQLVRERDAQLTSLIAESNLATQNDLDYVRDAKNVRGNLSEEQQLADWLDFQDKAADQRMGNSPAEGQPKKQTTQERLRGKDKQGRLLLSNLDDFTREKFKREQSSGRAPTLSQEQFDKKYFNAGNPNFSAPRQENPAQSQQIATSAPEPIPPTVAQSNVPQQSPEPSLANPILGSMRGVPILNPALGLGATPPSAVPPAPSGGPAGAPPQPQKAPDVVAQDLIDAALNPPGKPVVPSFTDLGDKAEDVRNEVMVQTGFRVDSTGNPIAPKDDNDAQQVKAEGRANQVTKEGVDSFNTSERQKDPKYVDKAFKDLPEEEKQKIRNNVMSETGANLSDDGKSTVPKDNFEAAINKLMGKLAIIMGPLTKFFEQFKKMTDKLKGKPVEKSKDEASKDRVDALLKAQPDAMKVEKDLLKTRDNASTAKVKAEKEKGTLDASLKSKQTRIDSIKASMLKMTPAQKDAREKAESDIAILGEQIQKDQEQINEKQKEIDKQKIAYDEAVLDLKTLFDINKGERAKKESEKISSIKDDGKWHSAAEVKNSAPGWEYAIGIDKRAYTRNGADVRVYNPATVGWEAFSGKVL